MAKKAKAPFLPVNRSFFETDMWLSDPFTPGQAWIDLNYLAAYERTRIIEGNHVYDLKPGQLRTSLDKLANRWNWNRKRVWRQLCLWKRNGLVHSNVHGKGYTLTIENYGFVGLQGNERVHDNVHDEGTNVSTDMSTVEGISSYYMKNEEKRNKEPENDFSSGPKIISEFRDPKTGEERVIIRP